MTYHKVVLLEESIKGLNINPDGIYVDVTFGGGSHSIEILKRLTTGKLFAFDQDADAEVNIPNDKKFKFLRANYKNIKNFLRSERVNKVDGILADLGVSSHQLDVPNRGFSFRFNSVLDMRMNKNSKLTARKVLNEYTKEQLSDLFYNYGEIKQSRRVASKIINVRKKKEIITTFDLSSLLEGMSRDKKRNQFLSQIFQSIRIEVNNEIESLKMMLEDGTSILNPKGRFVVISYHSLEDRIVKNLFKKGNIKGELHKDFFGNIIKNLNQINKKIIVPSDEEKKSNNRSRSAKLRIAEKV